MGGGGGPRFSTWPVPFTVPSDLDVLHSSIISLNQRSVLIACHKAASLVMLNRETDFVTINFQPPPTPNMRPQQDLISVPTNNRDKPTEFIIKIVPPPSFNKRRKASFFCLVAILKGTVYMTRGRRLETGTFISGHKPVSFCNYNLISKIRLQRKFLPQRVFEKRWKSVVRKLRMKGTVPMYLVECKKENIEW